METNLNNLPKFYIGQDVIALVTVKNGLIKDNHYKVSCYHICGCGQHFMGYGIKHNIPNAFAKATCHVCLGSVPNYGFFWNIVEHFAPIQQQSFPLMTFEKIAESEQKKETEKQLLINN